MSMELQREEVKIVGGSHGVSKVGKPYGSFNYKNSRGFTDNIFINAPSEDTKELLESFDERMGETITIVTSIES